MLRVSFRLCGYNSWRKKLRALHCGRIPFSRNANLYGKQGAPIRYAVLDFETNGFVGRSVVSASSIVFDGQGVILGYFNRFYFPRETPDWRTEQVHGLTTPRLAALRRNAAYPEFFPDDIEALVDFWNGLKPDGIVVHNLSFDTAFLPGEALSRQKWWCSMRGLTDVCAIVNPKRPGVPKWPKLQEAADRIADIFPAPPAIRDAEEALNRLSHAHASLSDCFVLGSIMSRIVAHRPDIPTFRRLRGSKFLPPPFVPYPRNPPGPEDSITGEIRAFEAALSRVMQEEGAPRREAPSHAETVDLPFPSE